MSIYRRAGEPYQVGDLPWLNELGTHDRFTVYEPDNHWPVCTYTGGRALDTIELGHRAAWAINDTTIEVAA